MSKEVSNPELEKGRGKTLPVAASEQTLKGGVRNDKESVLDCCVGCTTRGRDSEAKAEAVWLSPVEMYNVTPMFMERELQPNILNLSILSCKLQLFQQANGFHTRLSGPQLSP